MTLAAAAAHAATQSMVGPQALTFAIPIGTFAVVVLWGFFQRRRPLP
jgi:hypothetical protein